MAPGLTMMSLGLILAGGLLALSASFAYRQWIERNERTDELPAIDARYFEGKDSRRFGNSAIMAMIAVGIAAGVVIDPRAGRLQRQTWAAIWAVILILVLVLVVLALIDAFATYQYGMRQRQALADERLVLEYDLRRQVEAAAREEGFEGESS
jgi:cytochrome c oxidase subunit IV